MDNLLLPEEEQKVAKDLQFLTISTRSKYPAYGPF